MNTLIANFLQDQNNSWSIELAGNVDQKIFKLDSVQEIAPLLDYLVKLKVRRLVIDLSNTERLDSQGLQLLLVMHRQSAKEKIQVVLRNPSFRLKRLLRVMQFDRVFEIEEDNPINPLMLFLTPRIIRQ